MEDKPPTNAQRIARVLDLKQGREPAVFEIQNGDRRPRKVTLGKRKRQILETLMSGPVYCASPVRISDVVHILKRETGLDVKTEWYKGDRKTGAGDYGVYFLKSRVTALGDSEVSK